MYIYIYTYVCIYIYIVARACLRAWWMIFTHGSVQAALRSYFLASKVIHDMDVQSHYLVQVNQSRTKRAPEFSKIHMSAKIHMIHSSRIYMMNWKEI